MIDLRFHPAASARLLTELLDGLLPDAPAERWPGVSIAGVDELLLAGPDHLSLAIARAHEADLRLTRAGAVLVPLSLREIVPPGSVAIVSDQAGDLFAAICDRLYPGDRAGGGAGGAGHDPHFEPGVARGDNVVIGAGVEIGEGTVIGPNTVIGSGVTIGRNARIGANCTLECAYLGDAVIVQPGARIGCEGLAWRDYGITRRRIRQFGRVIVQDRVEIGANSAIERGIFGDTVIGENTRIGTLVRVGHNCRVGRNCIIVGAGDLASGTFLPDEVTVGGDDIPVGYRPRPGTR